MENDKALQDSLALLLRMKGCSVQVFSSAGEAIERLGPEPPGILVSAQDLPGMSGLEFLRHAGARYRDAVRILLIDAVWSGRFVEEAKRAGIEECLLKPLSIGDIERVVDRWLPAARPDEGR